jgi:transposase
VTVSVSKPAPITAQGAPLLSARKQLDVITAYRQVGTYRGAAEMCGTTHKTVKRIIERDRAAERVARRRNYESVRSLVAAKVEQTKGKISAKRLLPEARGAGYEGSDRNFRRLVAQEKSKHRQRQVIARSRRPAVWSPGEHLVIDWGVLNGLHVFCAVLAWSRVRFVRFAEDERAETTMRLLAECFSELGGVPRVVLADRMGCLKGGVVADVVIPTPDYVRFATHYRFRPDFCHAKDPESKGIVENLVGYAKSDLMVPLAVGQGEGIDLVAANAAAAAWCAEVNHARHSEIAAIPAQRLAEVERSLLAGLPSLLPSGVFGARRELRKVDKLSCVRFGSARYSVPNRMLGQQVEVLASRTGVTILVPGTGEVLAEHPLMAPGESSVLDAHYGRPRPATPARKVTPRSAAEQAFCALGPVAEQWLRSAAASGNTRLGPELAELAALEAAHGREALVAALSRAVTFGRWRASGVRSILAAGTGVPEPTEPGDALVIELPATASRSLQDYRLDDLSGGA